MKKTLIELGWTETETDIYLTLLKKGSMSAIAVSKEIKTYRRTIYDNLNTLTNKGYVTKFQENKINYFQANTPDLIITKEQQKITNLNEILPELKHYYQNQTKTPSAEIIKGKDALKNILNEMSQTKETILWLGGGFKILENINSEKQQLIKNLTKLKLKIIQPKNNINIAKKYFTKNIKYIESKYTTGTTFFVYQDKVIIGNITNDDFFVVKITDENIAKAYKNIFELLWKSN